MEVQPFTLVVSPPDESTKAQAVKELRETPEIVKQAIEELRQLLESDDTIYFKTTDEVLIMYLRPVKFYAKSAYTLVSILHFILF